MDCVGEGLSLEGGLDRGVKSLLPYRSPSFVMDTYEIAHSPAASRVRSGRSIRKLAPQSLSSPTRK